MNNERPGVYSSVEIRSSLTGRNAGRVVGLAGVSETGTKGECTRITSYGQAAALYGGDCQLTELIRLLMENGAGIIEAVPAAVGQAVTTADYEAAFGVLMKKSEVSIMVCGSWESAVHAALKSAIEAADENFKYRIGIAETSGTAAQAAAAAKVLNFERLVMVYPGQVKADWVCGSAAAAFAGALAGEVDPALPMNGGKLSGIDIAQGMISDTDINTLVRGGVTAIESTGGSVSVVRAVTTRTATGGEADITWRELTTMLIVDDVIPTIRAALRRMFPRIKNTAQTRGAIRTQVMIELERKRVQEIIESFGEVTAEPDGGDPTICAVGFDFTVVHGLNRIQLTAHISV